MESNTSNIKITCEICGEPAMLCTWRRPKQFGGLMVFKLCSVHEHEIHQAIHVAESNAKFVLTSKFKTYVHDLKNEYQNSKRQLTLPDV